MALSLFATFLTPVFVPNSGKVTFPEFGTKTGVLNFYKTAIAMNSILLGLTNMEIRSNTLPVQHHCP